MCLDLCFLICQSVCQAQKIIGLPKNYSFVWTVQLASGILRVVLEAVYSEVKGDVDIGKYGC